MTPARRTFLEIIGDRFAVNGKLLHAERGPAEGLLVNARLVQGVFDDLNRATRTLWAYPDGPWDPDRNTAEFVAAMPSWRRAGLAGFTINFQGGSPQGYSRDQPWTNPAFFPDGRLRPDYGARMERILEAADRYGFIVIVGFFYFGQDEHLADEAAVIRASDEATDFLIARGYANVVIEIANEAGAPDYDHAILTPDRSPELIQRVQERSSGHVTCLSGRFPVSASLPGGVAPTPELVSCCDVVLLHGNGVDDPAGIVEMIARCRAMPAYRGQPIVFNEDDHYGFEEEDNNMAAAIQNGAGWGYFDYRRDGEGFREGFQSVPVDWRIRSVRKRSFFGAVRRLTDRSCRRKPPGVAGEAPGV